MTIISPSILAADFLNLQRDIDVISNSKAQWVHLDIMDGLFVPNITFGYDLVAKINTITDKFLDTHLMINDPIRYVDHFSKAGSDMITFHIEAYDDKLDIIKCIEKIKNNDIKVGLAINPGTDVKEISEFIDNIDMVLVMSVEPGFGGQKFNDVCLNKIQYLRSLNSDILIQVDGGIDDTTAPLVKAAGANVLVAGSYIFNNDIDDSINSLM